MTKPKRTKPDVSRYYDRWSREEVEEVFNAYWEIQNLPPLEKFDRIQGLAFKFHRTLDAIKWAFEIIKNGGNVIGRNNQSSSVARMMKELLVQRHAAGSLEDQMHSPTRASTKTRSKGKRGLRRVPIELALWMGKNKDKLLSGEFTEDECRRLARDYVGEWTTPRIFREVMSKVLESQAPNFKQERSVDIGRNGTSLSDDIVFTTLEARVCKIEAVLRDLGAELGDPTTI